MIDPGFVKRLPFIVKPDNIARYEEGTVFILDRRVYPFEQKTVECGTYEDVAKAIEDMVTQSLGPGYAAGYGMVQAARDTKGKTKDAAAEYMKQAGARLIATRPTNHEIRVNVTDMLKVAEAGLANGETDLEMLLLKYMENMFDTRHEISLRLGEYGAGLISDGDAILNHCWAETTIVYTLLAALKQGKKLTAYCCETRPYLQGARLTASAISEMGIPTTIITDNMPAHLMSLGKVNKFFSGSDRVTMDGHVINKIGTMQAAICAHHFKVPYYPFCYGPDLEAKTPEDLIIEERNPEETLHCMGQRTAAQGVSGYYPAFDITPPEFVSGVVTDRGVFSPYDVGSYYKYK